MSRRHTVNPDSLPKPSGYAHGIEVDGVVYLGGQTALDKDMTIVPGGIVEQFRQAFSNVLTTLKEARIYLTDVDDYLRNGREIGRIWREMAGSEYPALAGIGVTRLWQKEALIEIEAVAVIGSSSEE
jgi:enamine deaminase RidA (YjgF/YER057c/UK114 family)